MQFPESAQTQLDGILKDGIIRAQPFFHGSRAGPGTAVSVVQERLLKWMNSDNGREWLIDRQKLLRRHGAPKKP